MPPRASSLAGRVALVTGASGGIGRAMVTALHEEGVTVVAVSRQPGIRASDFGDPRLGRLRVLTADMADLDSVPGLVEEVMRAHGRLDLLLPNAGTAEVRSLDEVSREDWQRSLDVNLTAPFLLAQAAAPVMVKQGWGRILFTSSAAAYVGGFVGPHYAAAKAGLHGLVHYLSSRFAPHGVTANALAPALVADTGMVAKLPAGAPMPPVGRLGTAGEIADLGMAVLRNGYFTGQVLLADGGIHPT
jgi:3-oxoacyl-[acyl-carrier protein] reductase